VITPLRKFHSTTKKRSKFNIFDKKKECAKGRLVVFSVIQVPGLSSYSILIALLGDYEISVFLRENHNYAGLT